MLELFQASPLRDFLMPIGWANLDIFKYRTTLILTLYKASQGSCIFGTACLSTEVRFKSLRRPLLGGLIGGDPLRLVG